MPIISGGGGSGSGAGAFRLLANSVLAAPAASFDFQALAQTASHLRIVAYLRDDGAGTGQISTLLRLNNDAAGNYDVQNLFGVNGTPSASFSAAATSAGAPTCAQGGSTASHFGLTDVLIPMYAATTGDKTILVVTGYADPTAANGAARQSITTWRSTAAVSRVSILPAGGATNFVAGSAVFVYGVT